MANDTEAERQCPVPDWIEQAVRESMERGPGIALNYTDAPPTIHIGGNQVVHADGSQHGYSKLSLQVPACAAQAAQDLVEELL